MNISPEIVPVQLEDNSTIRIQATPVRPIISGAEEIGDVVESDVSLNLQPLEDVAGSIEGIAKTIKKALDKVKPTKASVEFNVEFGWDAGVLVAMIAQGEGNASLKICLEWSESDKTASD